VEEYDVKREHQDKYTDSHGQHGDGVGLGRSSGLTSVVSALAVKPAGSRMISAGIRRRLASICEPTASTKIKPTPNRTCSVAHRPPLSRQPTYAPMRIRALPVLPKALLAIPRNQARFRLRCS
jgi:hypothetical protein